jgi:hypothetical protein
MFEPCEDAGPEAGALGSQREARGYAFAFGFGTPQLATYFFLTVTEST